MEAELYDGWDKGKRTHDLLCHFLTAFPSFAIIERQNESGSADIQILML